MLELIEKNIKLITDIGIETEIECFLCEEERLKSYEIIITEDKIYKVNIELHDYSTLQAINIFMITLIFYNIHILWLMKRKLVRIMLNLHSSQLQKRTLALNVK